MIFTEKNTKKPGDTNVSSNKYDPRDYDVDIEACSAMDCTGLIPALPQSEAEIEAYYDLYHFMPPTDAFK